ncbi:hypothetical protein GUJ93_ZPchr0006g46250 [Zizania palustris]|uniref:Uncharacterized protein n=1 Tax=Zizania palustris TaxID=103762 RepID=A0A8J5W519_ZIZPA|nr:hypothetical protein GUJ93_ZPchr0006g46250 [Zizania palustris]
MPPPLISSIPLRCPLAETSSAHPVVVEASFVFPSSPRPPLSSLRRRDLLCRPFVAEYCSAALSSIPLRHPIAETSSARPVVDEASSVVPSSPRPPLPSRHHQGLLYRPVTDPAPSPLSPISLRRPSSSRVLFRCPLANLAAGIECFYGTMHV